MSVKTNTFILARAPMVDSKGMLTWAGMQTLQTWNTQLANGLSEIGEFIGNISDSAHVGSRTEDIGTTLQNVDDAGVIKAPGIDFAREYQNQTLDYIADTTSYKRTTPNEVSGASTAYEALVASGPTGGQALVFNGTFWVSSQVQYSNVGGTPTLPANTPSAAHEFLNSYNSTTGAFTAAQPAFSDISGTASASQVPALSALSGAITAAQLPAAVPVVSFGSGAPSGSSTDGYLYFDTSVTPWQGYVYHSSAWNKFS